MDYLSLLPVELWRRLLLESTNNQLIPMLSLTNPLEVSRKPNIKELRHAQAVRAGLLTICKALLPIIEEILYSDVIILGQTALYSFTGRAEVILPNRRPRGQWTRRLIYVVYRYKINPSIITAACPNLESLHVTDSGDVFEVGCWNKSWYQNLLALEYSAQYLTWDDLKQISTQCSQLRYLKLNGTTMLFVTPLAAPSTPIVFPRLQYFVWETATFRRFGIDYLVMPKLQHASINTAEVEPNRFICQYGSILTTLEIQEAAVSARYILGLSDFLKLLFSSCPVLERLIFPFYKVGSFPPEQSFVPFQPLQTLILRANGDFLNADTEALLERYKRFFTERNFPNVSLLIVQLFPHTTDYRWQFSEIANSMFSAAVVEMYFDSFWVP